MGLCWLPNTRYSSSWETGDWLVLILSAVAGIATIGEEWVLCQYRLTARFRDKNRGRRVSDGAELLERSVKMVKDRLEESKWRACTCTLSALSKGRLQLPLQRQTKSSPTLLGKNVKCVLQNRNSEPYNNIHHIIFVVGRRADTRYVSRWCCYTAAEDPMNPGANVQSHFLTWYWREQGKWYMQKHQSHALCSAEATHIGAKPHTKSASEQELQNVLLDRAVLQMMTRHGLMLRSTV